MFRLALAMGEWDVNALERRMPSSLFARWKAFDKLEPISLGWRGDYQAGIVASMLANINRDATKRPNPFLPGDFIPVFGRSRPKPKSKKDLYQNFRGWAILAGAKAPEVKQ
jgi:hypothetical protein